MVFSISCAGSTVASTTAGGTTPKARWSSWSVSSARLLIEWRHVHPRVLVNDHELVAANGGAPNGDPGVGFERLADGGGQVELRPGLTALQLPQRRHIPSRDGVQRV